MFIFLFLIPFLTFSQDGTMHGSYFIANPSDTGAEPKFHGQWFDTYSPVIKSRYGDVFWQTQESVKIPDTIINAFNNKYIVLTGYESDFVRIDNNTETPVPDYEQYNHHFQAYIASKTIPTEMHSEIFASGFHNMGLAQKARSKNNSYSRLKKDGDYQFTGILRGSDHRKSWRGLGKGYGQLVYSPYWFISNPMIINTGIPSKKGGRCAGELPHEEGPCPMPYSSNSPKNSKWSGLLECPCSTRRNIVIQNYTSLTDSQTCNQPGDGQFGSLPGTKFVDSLEDCGKAAAEQNFLNFTSIQTINSWKDPYGCFLTSNENGYQLWYNFARLARNVSCGGSSQLSDQQGTGRISGVASSVIDVKLELDSGSDTATITLRGPHDVWFGIGFDATHMADEPYAIIITSAGMGAAWMAEEWKLGNHFQGTQLSSSITMISNDVVDDIRQVVLTRPLTGKTSDHYSFSMDNRAIPFINAIGSTSNFPVIHQQKASSTLILVGDDSTVCLCQTTGNPGSIDGISFVYECPTWPSSDILVQKNPTCDLTTYSGGLSCCLGGMNLIDADQEIPEYVDEIYVKIRWYYEEYKSHENVMHIAWSYGGSHVEHDVMQCKEGTAPEDCKQEMIGYFTLSDMFYECDTIDSDCPDINQLKTSNGVKMLMVKPHCHGPTCMKMELYTVNVSTGEMTEFCISEPVYGKGKGLMDEENYLVGIPPCVFGDEDAYQDIPLLDPDTVFFAKETANSTYAHHGNMNFWYFRVAFA